MRKKRKREERGGKNVGYELRSARYIAAEALERAVNPGDAVVDATMGNGRDTLFLCGLVGPAGHVYAFDIQAEAVERTRERLGEAGMLERATLFCLGHEHMAEQVKAPVAAVVFNLGWLPGGNHSVTTRWETTRQAVERALSLLKPLGVLVICVYPGHPEGERERQALAEWLSHLPPQRFNVLRHQFLNAGPGAPECFIAQKQRSPSSPAPDPDN